MPFVNKILSRDGALLFFWHIAESSDELCRGVALSEDNTIRLHNFKSEVRRRSFLAVQQLVRVAGCDSQRMYYDEKGKPHLRGANYISASHSNDYAVLAVGNSPIGVDIESHREQLLRIKHKFVNPDENWTKDLESLTQLWCLKEASYKLISLPGLGFKNSIQVIPKENNFAVSVNFSENQYHLRGTCFNIKNFVCACVTY